MCMEAGHTFSLLLILSPRDMRALSDMMVKEFGRWKVAR
jgi:hypothetical protein